MFNFVINLFWTNFSFIFLFHDISFIYIKYCYNLNLPQISMSPQFSILPQSSPLSRCSHSTCWLQGIAESSSSSVQSLTQPVTRTDVLPGDYRYQLALNDVSFGFPFLLCGATLIDHKTAVTAAHCVDGEQQLEYLQVLVIHECEVNWTNFAILKISQTSEGE